MADINKDTINEFGAGLHTDNSPQSQPKGTHRFALNAVNETELGDFLFPSNEESNQECDNFPQDYIPIGKEYMGEGKTIVFLVKNDESVSEIGIYDDRCRYETHVNDELSPIEDKLNFKLNKPIDATYRLRRGCERTVYFTDDYNKPRYYNFDKPEDFKEAGNWSGKSFNLFKEYRLIPEFKTVEVIDFGGVLEPGSYNISIQYVDEGLNPTEWITSSPVINIYNDLSTEDFLDIQGSINSDTDYINFPITTKSIKVEFDNLDESFAFYRLALIEANNGSGQVSAVKYTDTIPTSKNFFIFTGENTSEKGTEEEILFFNDIIYKAQSIEQIENRLILGNTQGKQVDFCVLQKYASKITADCVTKTILTNQLQDPRNTKNPTVHFGDMTTGGTGYMPGEIYSFAIVYVFEDGSISPAYHIPGKNPDVDSSMVFNPGPDTYPMSNENQSQNNLYIDNDNCYSNNYWGLDSEGDTLQGKPVRHHRFPLRSSIGVPLVEQVNSTGEQTFPYYAVELTATGTITLPVVCTQEEITAGTCTPVSAPPFQVRVTYTVDGVTETLVVTIDPAVQSNPVNILEYSNLYTSNNIVIVKIEEADENGVVTDVTTGVSPKGLTYIALPKNSSITTEGRVFETKILGIKFSNVELPSLDDTNGEKIVGYYIVRNERTNNERTILDTGVLVPSLVNSKYISHGLLSPQVSDTNKLSKTVFGLIHPEHKFNGTEYNNFDYIKQEGNFLVDKRNLGKTLYNDVLDGSSYDGDAHKGGNDDGHGADGTPDSRGYDGWCLTTITRDNYLAYQNKTDFNIPMSDVKEVFYLKALESRDINDGANVAYNIACDNRVGMIQLEQDDLINPVTNNLPYVLIGRGIADSYSNFRTLPYYKDSLNIEKFDSNGQSVATIFNGDTYVSPVRYTNSVFWDNRVAERAGRTSVWNYIIGGILIVVGAILTFFTAGASTLVIGAGIAIIGGGALFIASGIERDAMVRAYNEEYRRGLRETALDDWVDMFYKYRNSIPFGFSGNGDDGRTGPSDDEIQWIGDCLTDLWFESNINTSLRNKMTSDAPTFLDAPGIIETGNNSVIQTWEFFGKLYSSSKSRYPVSKLEKHVNKKLLVYNSKRNDTREYIGAALGEYYQVNPDYHRKNKQKIYYHLALEYDCCSDCKEDFPHRIHYSEQSFQEELTDNYRVFLPNNYRDIEGETGEIVNLFRIGNDLFIHTREALWQMPRSYQERVTDQIVSFIGTGSYFEIPPRKVIDDDTGSSAGTQHKWSSIKTPNGYFFVTESQNSIMRFDGAKLGAISDKGMYDWFFRNLPIKADEQYYLSNFEKYPYSDNVTNPIGTGFISTYDSQKERVIFTKKDFLFSEELTGNNGYQICYHNGQAIIFPNYQSTIDGYIANGWQYLGIENCRLKFRRDVIKTRTEIREVITNVPNTADIVVWLDTSGSFTASARQVIKDAIDSWLIGFASANPDWTGDLHYIEETGAVTEQWLYSLEHAKNSIYSGDLTGRDIIMVSFVNEANSAYHGANFGATIDNPTATFNSDYAQFIANYNTLHSFYGLSYPIVFNNNPNETSEFLKHVLAAVKGISYGLIEANSILPNPACPNWTQMLSALQGPNPYPDNGTGGLNQYNWSVISHRYFSGSGQVITAEQFQEDMNQFLQGNTSVETVEVEVEYLDTEFEYVDGEVIEEPVIANNSWTISYSFKTNSWVSFHSYLPEFYINTPQNFFSWIPNTVSNNMWKHNILGKYQTFYGQVKPFIVEYVAFNHPMITNITDTIKIFSEAKQYDSNLKEFVDLNDIFFDRIIVHNTRQCSGELNIIVKDSNSDYDNYLSQQIQNLNSDEIIADRNERDWTINHLRDIRVDYTKPIWNSDILSIQNEYFIDKKLNLTSIDYEKDWTQLESFRDKYLVVRLIFDNFARNSNQSNNVKMLLNYSAQNDTQSFR